MIDGLPIEERDQRNFLVVAAIMTVFIALALDEPAMVRAVVGLIMGVFSALVYLVVTLVLKRLIDAY
ncbi:hypothetical protein [Halapricum hydrolyticum]|uniref:Uncharacterized protein n=1 Tax=Halapricum hydrolyticum TaxID=2979991 RepID=A0AAE3ICF0_9EURY|nr:hypothetical protein [Halapricum hydrolyticum]MCU4719064.1 hypothetical protein [Halapricum hydrolyticum]MCU4728053.1 hypothetical protein [Halapricum hydrolyticum]